MVYNASQFENFPKTEAFPPKNWNEDPFLEYVVKASGIEVVHKEQNSAYFDASKNVVCMPEKDAFEDIGKYYGTLFHEWYHATGHSSRENRFKDDHSFGLEPYAQEELRAELFSLMMSSAFDLPCRIGQNAAYLDSWNKQLESDPREIEKQIGAAANMFSGFVVPLMNGGRPDISWCPPKESFPDYEQFKKDYVKDNAGTNPDSPLPVSGNLGAGDAPLSESDEALKALDEIDFGEDEELVDLDDPFGSVEGDRVSPGTVF